MSKGLLKMKKLASTKFLVLFVFVISILMAVGCSKQPFPEETHKPSPVQDEESSGEPVKIGFSMDTLKEERWLKDRNLFRQAVEELGAEIEIQAANGDDSLQIAQAEEMINKGIDVLVIVPHNAEAAAAIVAKAHRAGIKVLSYDRLVKNADIDLYVSFDNERVGELQALEMLKQAPKGKYVYIGGAVTDNNAHLLKKGAFNVLQPYIDKGDITVTYDQWTEDWTPANAYINMGQALQSNNNKVDAVIAANDATAGGAIQALGDQGLKGVVPVAGQDAELAGVQRVAVGTQTMTVYKPIDILTERAAELAIKLAKGERIDVNRTVNNGKIEVPSILLNPIAVVESNISKTIIEDGFHSREDIYQIE